MTQGRYFFAIATSVLVLLACGSETTPLLDAGSDSAVDAAVLGPPLGFTTPDECGGVPLAFDGELCAEDSCIVLRDELVAGPAEGLRNKRPSIAVAPTGQVHVAYSDATDPEGYQGFHAVAQPGESFVAGATGLRTAVPALTLDAEGAPILAANDGATHMFFYKQQSDGEWTEFGMLDDANVAPGRLFHDDVGCIHAGGSPTQRDQATVHTWNGSEFSAAPAGRAVYHGRPTAFSVSPSGTQHFVWSEVIVPNTTQELVWSNGEEAQVVVSTPWRGGTTRVEMGVDADEAPHLFYSRGSRALNYASQSAEGDFVTLEVESTDYQGCTPGSPENPGEECNYSVDLLEPIGIFVTGQGAHLAYLRITEEAELFSTCMGLYVCTWSGERTYTTSLVIATVREGEVTAQTIPTALGNARGTGVVATDGTMHFVFYEGPDSVVRYLQVGPTE